MKILFVLNSYSGIKKFIDFSKSYEEINEKITRFYQSWHQDFYFLSKKKNHCEVIYPTLINDYLKKKNTDSINFLDKKIKNLKPDIIFSTINTDEINSVIAENSSRECKSVIWYSAFVKKSDLLKLKYQYNYIITDNVKIKQLADLINFKSFFLMISIPINASRKKSFYNRKNNLYFSGSLSSKFNYRNKILNFISKYQTTYFRIRHIPERYKLLNFINALLIKFFPNFSKDLYKKKILPLTNNLKFFNKNEIYGKNLFDEMSNFKFCINCHSDFDRNSSINMRVFESLSCGNLLFTDDHFFMKKYFRDKEHLIYYANEEDLIMKIKYYKNNLDQAKKIANKGQNFILSSHNTIIRYKKFFSILKTIKS